MFLNSFVRPPVKNPRTSGFSEGHLLVAIPMHRMMGVMSALDLGIGGERGRARESIEREIDELGGVAPA